MPLSTGPSESQNNQPNRDLTPAEKALLHGTLLDARLDEQTDLGSVQGKYQLTVGQMSASKAWIQINGDRVLKSAGMTIKSKDFIAAYAFLKRRSAYPNIGDLTDLNAGAAFGGHLSQWDDLPTLKGPLEAYETNLLLQGNPKLKKALEAYEENLRKQSGGGEINQALRAVRGDEVVYRNRVKQNWREEWGAFVSEGSTASERRDWLGVYLGSRRLEAELSLYLRLNMQRQRLISVEGGSPSAQIEAEQRAHLIGTRCERGRLEDLLPELARKGYRFNLSSLDLVGPYSRTAATIFEELPLADKSFVMVNLLAKRENRFALEMLRKYYGKVRKLELFQVLRSQYRKEFGIVTEELKDRLWSELDREIEADINQVSSLRKGQLDALVLFGLGGGYAGLSQVHSSYHEGVRSLSEGGVLSKGEFMKHVGSEEMELFELLNNFRVEHKNSLYPHMMTATEMVMDVIFRSPKIARLRKYRYSSPINGRNSPFYTLMAEVHSGSSLNYDRWRHTAGFFLKNRVAIESAYVNQTEIPTLSLVGLDGREKFNGDVVSLNDRFVCRLNRSRIAELPYRTLLSDVREYEDWMKRYPASTPKFQRELIRREITVDGISEGAGMQSDEELD